jgi:hypothetical protein
MALGCIAVRGRVEAAAPAGGGKTALTVSIQTPDGETISTTTVERMPAALDGQDLAGRSFSGHWNRAYPHRFLSMTFGV